MIADIDRKSFDDDMKRIKSALVGLSVTFAVLILLKGIAFFFFPQTMTAPLSSNVRTAAMVTSPPTEPSGVGSLSVLE